MNADIHLNRISSQSTNVNLEQLRYWRWLFCIRLAKSLDSSTLLINIDETNINYKTKTNYSWSQRGGLREFKSKPFSGSINMIMTIMSNGAWFWTFIQRTTNSEIFRAYWMSLIKWMEDNQNFKHERVIVLLDNCSSHRASIVKQEMIRSKLNIWFLPPYSYMLAPIEKAF